MFDILKWADAVNKSRRKGLLRNEKAFTLVELLIVVAIIGVLVAIALPMYGQYTAGANKRAVETNLRTIDGAIQAYYAEHSDYPTGKDDLEGEYIDRWPEGPDGTDYFIDTDDNRVKANLPSDADWASGKLEVLLPIDWE